MKFKTLSAVVITLLLAQTAFAGQESFSASKSLEQYIKEAEASQPALATTQGSLYNPQFGNSFLFTDLKARHLNDLITISVVESTSAESSANAQTNRSSAIGLSAPNLFGAEGITSKIPFDKLVNTKSGQQFKGDGSTQRSGSVSTTLSGHVKVVLPNGNMVIEAVKEVKVNNERQVLRLFGVVRPMDVAPNNVVSSAAISNLLLQVDGKGELSDSIRQAWLFRILTKVWPF